MTRRTRTYDRAHFTAEDTWINALQTPPCNLIMVGSIRLSLPMVVI
ncbi:hypothetical protein [Actinomyces oricola]